ncbi:MAG: hypothetical protein ACXVCY_19565 [Pseudobdellovibrionaceae bacterium]
MKIVKYFLVYLFALNLFPFRSSADELPKDVEYFNLYDLHSEYPASVDKLFSAMGFDRVDMPGLNRGEAISWLNRIYYNKYGATVLVKNGLVIQGSVDIGHSYSLKKGTLVHFKSGDSQIAFLFKGLSKGTTAELIKGLNEKLSKVKATNALIKMFLPSAFAASNYFCSEEKPSTSTAYSAMEILKAGGSCVNDIAKGVWNSTGGFALDVGSAILHPIDTWNKASDEADRFTNFIGNFENSFGEFKNQIAGLPAPVKAKILCETAGDLGSGTVVSFFTGGAGSAMLLKSMSKAVETVAKIQNSSSLAITANRLSVKAERTERALANVKDIKSGKHLAEKDQAYKKLEEKFRPLEKEVDDFARSIHDKADYTKMVVRNIKNTDSKIEELIFKAHGKGRETWDYIREIENVNGTLSSLHRMLNLKPEFALKLSDIEKSLKDIQLAMHRKKDGYVVGYDVYDAMAEKLKQAQILMSKIDLINPPLKEPTGGWSSAEQIAKLAEMRKKIGSLHNQVWQAEADVRFAYFEADRAGELTANRLKSQAATLPVGTCKAIGGIRSAVEQNESSKQGVR